MVKKIQNIVLVNLQNKKRDNLILRGETVPSSCLRYNGKKTMPVYLLANAFLFEINKINYHIVICIPIDINDRYKYTST